MTNRNSWEISRKQEIIVSVKKIFNVIVSQHVESIDSCGINFH